MKTITQFATACLACALLGNNAHADLFAFYGDGTLEDADAEANLASPVSNVTLSNLDSFGVLAGSTDENPEGGDGNRITRPSFSTDTPAGPTANSFGGSEWFEARSRENLGTPSSTNNYFFFTADADPGFALDLDVLKYDFWISDAVGSGAIADAEAFVSVDGAAFTSFGSINASDTDGDINLAAPVATANIDLSSITGAESVEVRIGIGYSQGNSNGISGFVQGIQLEGTVGIAGGGGGVSGDYNDDGIVDLADYTIWRNNLGEIEDGTVLAGNGNDDGFVDSGDYSFWKANYGNSGSISAVATATVPESGTAALALIALLSITVTRKCTSKK